MSTIDVDTELTDDELTDDELTDDELTMLALAADPDQALDADAVPWSAVGSDGSSYAALPEWYMPAPMARGGNRWRTAIVLAIVASLLLIEAVGLCVTYGQLVRA